MKLPVLLKDVYKRTIILFKLKRLIKKYRDKELKEYILWKFGFDKIVQKYTKDYWGKGKNYNWIYDILINDKDLIEGKSFLEIGSRDALDSISLLENFNFSKAYVFEPSYPGIIECIDNITRSKHREKLILSPFLIGESTTIRNFYENTEKKDVPNIGASSVHSSEIEGNEVEYKVPQFKLSDLNFQKEEDFFIALIDVEGAEYEVLSGGEDVFRGLKYICIEVQYTQSKSKFVPNASKVIEKLNDYGFDFVKAKNQEFDSLEDINDFVGSVDLLFINKNYFH